MASKSMKTLFEDYPAVQYDGLEYNTQDINKAFKIKVSGKHSGYKIHKLVGVSGLLELIGIKQTNILLDKGFKSTEDKVEFKPKKELKVILYRMSRAKVSKSGNKCRECVNMVRLNYYSNRFTYCQIKPCRRTPYGVKRVYPMDKACNEFELKTK